MKTRISPILITFALVCFVLLKNTDAVSPPPDGGYPGGNTAEGTSALFSRTTGIYNTAIGYLSLLSDTEGQLNTAIGAGTLLSNTADNNTATGAAALLSNTTAGFNTANGAFALFSNTTRTRLSELKRSRAIPPAHRTRPFAPLRSEATPRDATTSP